jgi:hypothetical protein
MLFCYLLFSFAANRRPQYKTLKLFFRTGMERSPTPSQLRRATTERSSRLHHQEHKQLTRLILTCFGLRKRHEEEEDYPDYRSM